jgi:hypothetical protein
LLFAGSNEKGYDDAVYYKQLADATRHWLPELAGKEPIFAWAVDLAITAEMIPLQHELSTTAQRIVIEGLVAHGMLPGMVLAQQAGEFIIHRVLAR